MNNKKVQILHEISGFEKQDIAEGWPNIRCSEAIEAMDIWAKDFGKWLVEIETTDFSDIEKLYQKFLNYTNT